MPEAPQPEPSSTDPIHHLERADLARELGMSSLVDDSPQGFKDAATKQAREQQAKYVDSDGNPRQWAAGEVGDDERGRATHGVIEQAYAEKAGTDKAVQAAKDGKISEARTLLNQAHEKGLEVKQLHGEHAVAIAEVAARAEHNARTLAVRARQAGEGKIADQLIERAKKRGDVAAAEHFERAKQARDRVESTILKVDDELDSGKTRAVSIDLVNLPDDLAIGLAQQVREGLGVAAEPTRTTNRRPAKGAPVTELLYAVENVPRLAYVEQWTTDGQLVSATVMVQENPAFKDRAVRSRFRQAVESERINTVKPTTELDDQIRAKMVNITAPEPLNFSEIKTAYTASERQPGPRFESAKYDSDGQITNPNFFRPVTQRLHNMGVDAATIEYVTRRKRQAGGVRRTGFWGRIFNR